MSVNAISRMFWLVIGILSLGCGIAGTVLPLVPTTPFVLVSVFAFAKSSPRLHNWLINHPKFGPLIQNWQQYGAIDRRTKTIALTVMVLTPIVTWLIGASSLVVIIQIIVLSCSAIFIVTRPETGSVKKTRSNEIIY